MSDNEVIEAVVELINDYGVGLTGELRTKALALIAEGQAARKMVAIMTEAGSDGYWKELMLDGKNPKPIVVEKS